MYNPVYCCFFGVQAVGQGCFKAVYLASSTIFGSETFTFARKTPNLQISRKKNAPTSKPHAKSRSVSTGFRPFPGFCKLFAKISDICDFRRLSPSRKRQMAITPAKFPAIFKSLRSAHLRSQRQLSWPKCSCVGLAQNV